MTLKLRQTSFLRLGLTACAAFCLALGTTACGDDDDDAGNGGNGNNNTQFTAGSFQFTTLQVQDLCLGGALDALFMPDGTPYDFANLVPMPAPAVGDSSVFTVPLQEPFNDMQVDLVRVSEGAFRVENAPNNGVVLDEARWGDCSGDLTINVDLTIVDADNLTGTASLSMTNVTSTGDTCPVIEDDNDPCPITLTLRAARQN